MYIVLSWDIEERKIASVGRYPKEGQYSPISVQQPFYYIAINEPGHEKMCLMSDVNNKGTDQPAHPRSLISAFVVRCLDSIISLDSIAEISRLQLVL